MKKFKLGPNQKKWLRALESGKYRRGQCLLKVDYGKGFLYCCLGVACEVAGVDWSKQPDDDRGYVVDGEDGVLPKRMIEWLGVFGCEGETAPDDDLTHPSMVKMNDRLDLSFKKIAARIRKNPELYFKKSV